MCRELFCQNDWDFLKLRKGNYFFFSILYMVAWLMPSTLETA